MTKIIEISRSRYSDCGKKTFAEVLFFNYCSKVHECISLKMLLKCKHYHTIQRKHCNEKKMLKIMGHV